MSPAATAPAPARSSASAPTPAKPAAAFEGMGAVRLKKGVGFRVWAPHADAVSVVGSFNDWKDTAHPLERDESGHWSGVVMTAKPGDEYRYSVRRGENTFTRIDPRALKVTNSVVNGVLWWPDPAASGPRFT